MKLENPTKTIAITLTVVFLLIGLTGFLHAQQTPDAQPQAASKPISLWTIIASAGLIGYVILLMSLAAMSFIVANFISIRPGRLLPETLITELDKQLAAKQYDQAQKACDQDGSFLAQIVQAGLQHTHAMLGFYDMQNAMQEVSQRELSRLYRKLEYLSFIAATAPMMGLLGTVVGMMRAFNQIALTEGTARPSQLAGGISEALVTTCLGLIVAIPTMFFVSYFRNRIENCVNEAETIIEKLMGRFRQRQEA